MKNEGIQEYYANTPSAKWLVLVSICLTNFLNSVTNSSVNVATPTIASALQANAILVSWIPTSFLLSSVVMLLPAGRLADIHGRKKLYVSGIVIFIITSILASLSVSIEMLLAIRLLQGIGSAMIFATGLAIITSVFPAENRGVSLGIASASVYFGLSCGPLIGGWFTEVYGWRSVFLFPVPFSMIACALIVVNLKGEWKSQSPTRVDWLGGLIFAIWSSAFFIGVSTLPGKVSYLLLGIGAACLILFYYQQVNSKHPLVRFRAIMDNHVFSRSLMASVCVYASNYPLIFLFSLYLQFIQGLSPHGAGQIMVLQAITMAILAPIAGRLSDRFEPRIIATGGCLIMACAFGMLDRINDHTSLYYIAGCLMTLGFGFGLFTTPNNNAALSAIDRERLGIASALLNLSRVIGNMTGIAMVMILVSLIIGHAEIKPQQYPALMTTIRWALALSCIYALSGAYFSFTRGNIRIKQQAS